MFLAGIFIYMFFIFSIAMLKKCSFKIIQAKTCLTTKFVGFTNDFFSLVLQIIFDWHCEFIFTSLTDNYFFIGAETYFSRYREFIFWPTIHRGLPIEWNWLEYLTF